jgi:hypothetical protein
MNVKDDDPYEMPPTPDAKHDRDAKCPRGSAERCALLAVRACNGDTTTGVLTMRTSRAIGIACMGLTMLISAPLLAQPTSTAQTAASTPDTALTDKARELYIEGQKAGTKKKWGEAYANFLAAWSLKRHWQVAGNLGWVEVELGKYRDAAEHLALYLREAPKDKVKERQSAEVLLAEARKRVGALQLNVEPAGAEVLVDGASVGKAPLAGEVFVEPGKRAIEARLDGYTTMKTTMEMAAGASREVPLRLVKSEASAEKAGGNSVFKDSKSNEGTRTESEERGPSKTVIIAGIATSVVAIGAGVGFAVASNGYASDADKQRAATEQRGVPYPCSTPAYAKECGDHTDTVEAQRTYANLSVFSVVLGGVLGATTAIYALMTPASKPAATKPTTTVRAAPVAMARGGGVVIVGRW